MANIQDNPKKKKKPKAEKPEARKHLVGTKYDPMTDDVVLNLIALYMRWSKANPTNNTKESGNE